MPRRIRPWDDADAVDAETRQQRKDKAAPKSPWVVETVYVARRRNIETQEVVETLGEYGTASEAEKAIIRKGDDPCHDDDYESELDAANADDECRSSVAASAARARGSRKR